ncbi:response regulator [Cryobacterium sp. CG_9.6]|uniref:response regulator n=1 Tax=Cryobacterium sp. CG_9.6 TaxID=2760710 RepID=UPI002474F1EC|nr:response regulator [Cryobacterium sp. CG_9.6]MDH6237841.1 response regulator of citrate/malate metabolism [Cryobacterium sp. CG_9.6]
MTEPPPTGVVQSGGGARRLRTVIVDDDTAVVDLHVKFVESHPAFQVVATAHSGPGAVRAILDHTPDLVLLDFYLPGLSGLDVLRDIRSRSHQQPEFIAVTAARDADSVRRARVAGVRHYLVKPFSAADLRVRLDEIVTDRSLLAVTAPGAGLEQSSIDSIMTGSIRRTASLPKGLSLETLDAVAAALNTAPDSTASDLGGIAGISRVSTRRYLEHLVLTQRAVRSLDYTTAGRPSARYRAITSGAPAH